MCLIFFFQLFLLDPDPFHLIGSDPGTEAAPLLIRIRIRNTAAGTVYAHRLCHADELGVLVPRGVEGVELHQRVFEPGQHLVHAQAVQDHRT